MILESQSKKKIMSQKVHQSFNTWKSSYHREMREDSNSYKLLEDLKEKEKVINLLAKPILELNHLLKCLISKDRLKEQSQSKHFHRTRKLHRVQVVRTLLHLEKRNKTSLAMNLKVMEWMVLNLLKHLVNPLELMGYHHKLMEIITNLQGRLFQRKKELFKLVPKRYETQVFLDIHKHMDLNQKPTKLSQENSTLKKRSMMWNGQVKSKREQWISSILEEVKVEALYINLQKRSKKE
jgi:hypothetical protein